MSLLQPYKGKQYSQFEDSMDIKDNITYLKKFWVAKLYGMKLIGSIKFYPVGWQTPRGSNMGIPH